MCVVQLLQCGRSILADELRGNIGFPQNGVLATCDHELPALTATPPIPAPAPTTTGTRVTMGDAIRDAINEIVAEKQAVAACERRKASPNIPSPRALLTSPQQALLKMLHTPKPGSPHTHGTLAIDYLTASDLAAVSVAEFQSRYMIQNRPVVVEDPSICRWGGARPWGDLGAFAAKHGEEYFTTAEIPYPEAFGATITRMRLKDFISTVIRQVRYRILFLACRLNL